MNLEMLKAMKARGMAQAPSPRRQLSAAEVAIMKMKVLGTHFGGKQTCGSCTRWLTCTKLHRSGHVSPMFAACMQYQFDSSREYQNG